MEGKQQQNASPPKSLAEIELPAGDGPKPHPPRFLDPRIVEAHFAPLMKARPSARERWAGKANSTAFGGL